MLMCSSLVVFMSTFTFASKQQLKIKQTLTQYNCNILEMKSKQKIYFTLKIKNQSCFPARLLSRLLFISRCNEDSAQGQDALWVLNPPVIMSTKATRLRQVCIQYLRDYYYCRGIKNISEHACFLTQDQPSPCRLCAVLNPSLRTMSRH